MLKFYLFANMYCKAIVTAKLMGKKGYLNPRLGNLTVHIPQDRTQSVLDVGRFLMRKKVLNRTDSFPGTKSGFPLRSESLTQTPDSFPAAGDAPCTAMVRSEDIITPWVIREGILVHGCSHIYQLKV